MTNVQQLNQLRRRAYLAYHQDGLIDILIGLAILGFGLNIATDGVTFLALAWLPVLLYVPIKNRITVPRFGYVSFDSEQKTRSRMVYLVAMGLLSFFLLLGLYFALAFDSLPQSVIDWLGTYHMLLFGIGGAIMLTVGAFWLGIRRLYAYAILAPLIILAGILWQINTALFMLVLGAIPFCIGAWMLVRFLRTHPVLDGEEFDHASQR